MQIEHLPNQDLFTLVFSNKYSIQLPTHWFLDVSNDYQVVSFHKLSPVDIYDIGYIEKRLVITQGVLWNNIFLWTIFTNINNWLNILDSRVIIHLNGKEILLSDIGLNNTINNSIEYVQLLLNTLENIKCCRGAGSSNKYSNIKSSLGSQYIETNGQWRHKQCCTIIEKNEK